MSQRPKALIAWSSGKATGVSRVIF